MSIEESYNAWASQYDIEVNKTRDLDREATSKTLDQYSFSSVLELGSGTGKNTSVLLSQCQEVVCCDFSDNMLSIAKEKLKGKGVRFVNADITQPWTFTKKTFDLITCSLVLEHIADLDFIFKEAAKKLNKDGLFFISELHPFKQYVGSKARFENETGLHSLTTFVHHIGDYLKAAHASGFSLEELNEWFDKSPEKNIPRLATFVFKK